MDEDNRTGEAGRFLKSVVNFDHVHVMKCIFELREEGKINLTLKHDSVKVKSEKELDAGQELLLIA